MIQNLDETITNSDILGNGYIERDGYIFTALTYPYNVYDTLIIRCPAQTETTYPQYAKSMRSLDEHICLINEYLLEKAIVIAETLDFIVECPSLKYLHVIPTAKKDAFDFSPLYDMPEIISLTCQTCYGSNEEFCAQIDYQKIEGLIDLGVSGKGHTNFNKIDTLKSIHVSNAKINDFRDVFCSSTIDTIRIVGCGIKTLDGIEQSENITCLYLHYNRSLRDISALRKVKSTLRTLRIENCPKIEDFSVLNCLENLELLEMTGNNTLNNLGFLKEMKNLKTFIFNVNIKDGDLTPCLKLNYVYCDKSRKHYNLKDKDLPKGKFIRGNESIDKWRRLE